MTHAAATSTKVAVSSLVLCLLTVIVPAKAASPKLEAAVESAGATLLRERAT